PRAISGDAPPSAPAPAGDTDEPVAQALAAPPAATPTRAPAPVVEAMPTNPLAIVQRIKDATVFIKVGDGKKGGTGSGFVIRHRGDETLIATNRHVVAEHDEDDDDAPPKSTVRATPLPI